MFVLHVSSAQQCKKGCIQNVQIAFFILKHCAQKLPLVPFTCFPAGEVMTSLKLNKDRKKQTYKLCSNYAPFSSAKLLHIKAVLYRCWIYWDIKAVSPELEASSGWTLIKPSNRKIISPKHNDMNFHSNYWLL